MDATQKYRDRHKFLKDQRKDWEDQYKDIADYILPRKGFFFDKDQPNRGDTRHSKIIDGTAGRAMRTLAAGLQGGLTSPSRPWFRLSLENQEWSDHPLVKEWLALVEKRLRHALSQSNFYQSAHFNYTELGGFGTGAIFVDRSMPKRLHFKPLTVGEYCIATDKFSVVDTLYREMYLTTKQMVERFGSGVSSEVSKIYEKNPYEYIKVVHAVQPNKDRVSGKMDNHNKKWESVYYEDQFDFKLLNKSGFDSFPYAVPRWDVSGTDVYGRGPGMDCLPDVKMLQLQVKSIAKAIQKSVDPPLQAPGNMKGKVNLLPAAVNYVDEGEIQELVKSRPDIQAAIMAREDTRQAIREGFFNDLFLLLTQPNQQTTATEILERKEEKMLMLGPIVERQHTEFGDVIIEQALDHLMDDPEFPLLPDELMNQIGDYKIEYVSVLAQAQKMAGTMAIQRTAEFAGSLAQGFPEILDKVDADEMLDEFHDLVGAPPNIIKPDEEVEVIREDRAAQQKEMADMQKAMAVQQMEGQRADNQQKTLQGAKTAGEAMKTAGEVDVEGLMNNIQGIS